MFDFRGNPIVVGVKDGCREEIGEDRRYRSICLPARLSGSDPLLIDFALDKRL